MKERKYKDIIGKIVREEILVHALYQIQTNLKDKLADDKQKLENIKSIVKESLAYYERNVDK